MDPQANACFKCREPLFPEDFSAGRAFRIGSLDACGNCVDSLLMRLTKDQRRNLLAKNPALAHPRPLPPRRSRASPADPAHRSPLSPETETAVADAQAVMTPPEALPAQGRGHTTTTLLRLVGPIDAPALPTSSRNRIVIGAIVAAAVVVVGLMAFLLSGGTAPSRREAPTPPPPSAAAAAPRPTVSAPDPGTAPDPETTLAADRQRLGKEVEELIGRREFAKALASVQASAGRHNTFAWTVAVQSSRRAIEQAAEAAFPELRERARRARERGDDAGVDRIRAEVNAWSMSRLATELQEALAEPLRDLAGWWRLDEKEGTTARDASGLEHHARLVGNPSWLPSGGRIGGALLFKGYDGTDDYVELPVTRVIDGLHKTDFSIAAWFRPDSAPPGRDAENNAYYGILVRPGMHMGLSYQSSRMVGFSLWLGKNEQVGDLVHPEPSPPGVWRHVAATVSLSEGRVTLYVDGRRSRASTFRPGSAPHDFGNQPWRIGIAAPGQSEWRWAMDGAVDEVHLYRRALSDAEALELFRAAAP